MNSKAQTAKIFVYILILVIVVLVIYFGYKSIIGMRDGRNEGMIATFKVELQSDISSIKSEYGSVHVENYEIPPGFEEICFADLKHVDANDILDQPLIKDSVASGAQQNIFLVSRYQFESIFVNDMGLQGYPYYFCVTAGESVKLSIAGTGDASVIKMPVDSGYCENAQTTGLCEGLDLFFEGYLEECQGIGYCITP